MQYVYIHLLAGTLDPADCPDNTPITGIAAAIAQALSLYKDSLPEPRESERACACLFVVQPNEQNVFDQRHLEFELWDKHHVPVIRASAATSVTTYLSSYYSMCPHITIYVSSCCCYLPHYICVVIRLYNCMCPHTAICVVILPHVSSYSYLLYVGHTTIYVSSYCYILYMGHSTVYVSSYCYILYIGHPCDASRNPR